MLKEKLSHFNIILASGSPRRQNFLKQLDIPFKIDVRKIEEIYPDHLQGVEITNYLSELKSKAFLNLKENDIVITSDTIVWFHNQALEKPKNQKDAFLMLQSLSGKKHSVFTSVTIKSKYFLKTFADETSVEFEDLSKEEIDYYLKNFAPYDKAGSYGIQDWIGLIGVKKIEGSYFNVMGLPVHKLYKELMKLP